MNRLSKQLKEIAEQIASQQLQAMPTDTKENFNNYSDDYYNIYGERPDPKLWDLFDTQEEVQAFLKNKSQSYPHLKEIIGQDTIKRLLDEDWFVILSAGRNGQQLEHNSISDQQIEQRYEQLRIFLQKLNLPYYEVIGQYNHASELSYIVDLSDGGKKSEEQINNNLRKIRQFCGDQLKQDSIIEGLGKQRIYLYTGGINKGYYHKRTKQLPMVNDIGRSQVFTDRRKPITWGDDFDWDNLDKME